MYRFCPQCASTLERRQIQARALLACPSCDFIHYNNSRPCTGVLVLDQGRLLLVERADEPFQGYWDIPGGFLEAGEHPEAGAKRELLEETGLEIEITGLLGFFMDTYGEGDIPTLNICYLARVTGGQARAGSDAARLHWFPVEELPDRIAFHWEQEALEQWTQDARGRGGSRGGVRRPGTGNEL